MLLEILLIKPGKLYLLSEIKYFYLAASRDESLIEMSVTRHRSLRIHTVVSRYVMAAIY